MTGTFLIFLANKWGTTMTTESKSSLLKDIGTTIMLIAGVFFVVWVVVYVALSISTNSL
jgi:hypothetical protein